MYCVSKSKKKFKIGMDNKLSCFQVYGYCKVGINVLKKSIHYSHVVCTSNTLCVLPLQQVTNRLLNALLKFLSTKPPTLVLDFIISKRP